MMRPHGKSVALLLAALAAQGGLAEPETRKPKPQTFTERRKAEAEAKRQRKNAKRSREAAR